MLKLFELFNEKYFDGQLKPIAGIEVSDRINGAGLTTLRHTPSPTIKVALSSKLVENTAEYNKVLVHELVHVWQIQQYLESGNEIFLDSADDGHGPIFSEIAEEIIFHHPEMDIRSADPIPMPRISGVSSFYYVDVIFEAGGTTRRSIFNFPGKTMPLNDYLKSGLEKIYGVNSLISFAVKETTDPACTCYASLTNRNKFYTKQPPVFFEDKDLLLLKGADQIVQYRYDYPIRAKTLTSHDMLNEKFRSSLHLSFGDYLLSVARHVPGLSASNCQGGKEVLLSLLENSRGQDLRVIHQAWMACRAESIDRTKEYHDLMHGDPLFGTVSGISEKLLSVVKNFGWKRSLKGETLRVIERDLSQRVSMTVVEEVLNFLEPRLGSAGFFEKLRGAVSLISEQKELYIFENIFERLSDGYIFREQLISELESEWLQPSAESLRNGGAFAGNTQIFASEILAAHLNGNAFEMQRKIDQIVLSWSSLITRGVHASDVKSAFLAEVTRLSNSVTVGSTKAWKQNQKIDELVQGLPALIDSSISHCYGSRSSEFRKRRCDSNQIGLFR